MNRDPRSYCTIRVDELLLGVAVTRIQEVVRAPCLTPVPLASPLIAGLINLRGEIVMCVDLRRCLGLLPSRDPVRHDHVVVGSAERSVSLMVDRVGEVVEVDERYGGAVERAVRGRLGDLISGMYRVGDEVLIALDLDKTMDVDPALHAVSTPSC